MANAIKKDNIPREKDCLEKMEITIRPLTHMNANASKARRIDVQVSKQKGAELS
jgi:hypothetical protein